MLGPVSRVVGLPDPYRHPAAPGRRRVTQKAGPPSRRVKTGRTRSWGSKTWGARFLPVVCRVLRREAFERDAVGPRFAAHALHSDSRHALLLSDLEHLDDARMAESGRAPGLGNPALTCLVLYGALDSRLRGNDDQEPIALMLEKSPWFLGRRAFSQLRLTRWRCPGFRGEWTDGKRLSLNSSCLSRSRGRRPASASNGLSRPRTPRLALQASARLNKASMRLQAFSAWSWS